jgi:alanine racemase
VNAARAVLQVDLGAIRHNLGLLREQARGAAVMAVVKGDAYGLGALPVARVLRQEGVRAFAVDNVAEGRELRDAGIDDPILIIDGDVAENAQAAVAARLMPGVPNLELARAYQAAAGKARLPVWLVANVGFNRSGFRDPVEFGGFVAAVGAMPELEVQAVYAHLTNSHAERTVCEAQIAEFSRLVSAAEGALGRRVATSLFASHGIPRFCATTRTDWVRPGALLYGEHMYVPSQIDADTAAAAARYRPAISLRARLCHRIAFSSEQAIGYGQVHRVAAGTTLATVAMGFGRGYPPGAKNLPALVRGRRVRTVGAVGMDALQIDVTEVPEAVAGDQVTLIGSDGNQRIGAAELAAAAGLSPYELLSRLSVARHHHEGT